MQRKFDMTLFMGPALVFMCLLMGYPMVQAVISSLSDLNLISPQNSHFIGLENYRELFLNDSEFWLGMKVTLFYTFGTLAGGGAWGLGIAALLRGTVHGKRAVYALLLVPMSMAPVACGLIWRVFFWDRNFGLINYGLSVLGFKHAYWLSDPILANVALIATGAWRFAPISILVLSAAMSKLPDSVFEAARIDGASAWKLFTRITIPMIKMPLLFVMLFGVTAGIRMFDLPYIMTGGAPGYATRLLSLYVSWIGIRCYRLGYGNAIGVVLLIMAAVSCVLIIRVVVGRREQVGLWEE